MEHITKGTAPLILDVRSRQEYVRGHVPGAMHIPFWQMARRTAEFLTRRDDPIVVYCGHGPRAYIAGAALRRRGFRHVAYLSGHMKHWKSMKLPVEVG